MTGQRFFKVLTLLLSVMVLACPGAVFANTGPAFSDVNSDGPYRPYINFLYKKGVMKGYPDGTFRPGSGLTRAEAVTALSIAAGISPSGSPASDFKDVPGDHWAAGYVAAGTAAGILKGYPDGAFRPENTVTRAELAALLVNLSGLSPSSSPAIFPDLPSGHWAGGLVDAAMKNSLFLTSPADQYFDPEGPATREVFARGAALAVTLSPKYSMVNLAGQVSPLAGKVWVFRDGQESALSSATGITPGTVVRTGSEGEAQIIFEDGSGFLVRPNTYLVITRARGRAAIGSDGTPLAVAGEIEVKLDAGKIVGSCINRQAPAAAKTASAESSSNLLVASSRSLPWSLAEAAGAGRTPPQPVRVIMPWGTAMVSGFWTNEVTPTGQSTAVLVGLSVVQANGREITVKAGEASTIASANSPPEPPRAMNPNEAGLWGQVNQWLTDQAEKIEKVIIISNLAGVAASLQTPAAQPQAGLRETVAQSIATASESAQNQVQPGTQPVLSGGGGGGAVAVPQLTPGVSYSMDYLSKDLTPGNGNPEADGYQVNIYLNSLANATYIEYTFEYDNSKLTSLGINLDLFGIATAFAAYPDLSLNDVAIDSGWVPSGGRTYRTIRSKEFAASQALSYSGGQVRLSYLDFKRVSPGDAVVSIKNIKVSYGSNKVSVPDVVLYLPEL